LRKYRYIITIIKDKWDVIFNYFCIIKGATRTTEAREVIYARQYCVMVAKAFKLQAIDIVYIDYKGKSFLK
jgi:citrate lyase subunit beta-like protein